MTYNPRDKGFGDYDQEDYDYDDYSDTVNDVVEGLKTKVEPYEVYDFDRIENALRVLFENHHFEDPMDFDDLIPSLSFNEYMVELSSIPALRDHPLMANVPDHYIAFNLGRHGDTPITASSIDDLFKRSLTKMNCLYVDDLSEVIENEFHGEEFDRDRNVEEFLEMMRGGISEIRSAADALAREQTGGEMGALALFTPDLFELSGDSLIRLESFVDCVVA